MEIIPLVPERKKKNQGLTVFIFLVKRKKKNRYEQKKVLLVDSKWLIENIFWYKEIWMLQFFASILCFRVTILKLQSFLVFSIHAKKIAKLYSRIDEKDFGIFIAFFNFLSKFDSCSNDNIYRRNRTERSCFITSRWIEG